MSDRAKSQEICSVRFQRKTFKNSSKPAVSKLVLVNFIGHLIARQLANLRSQKSLFGKLTDISFGQLSDI